MMRWILFIVTNLAVLLVISIVCSVLGIDRALTANGLSLSYLLVFSLFLGFSGSLISLFLSKFLAKMSTGARVITQPVNETERWLLSTVSNLSQRAGIRTPEVAIYDGAPNAFATGAFKNSALVAVSTELLMGMTHEEVEAVLGHEISHIVNGDMVTQTLLQGVLNTFVIFLSRIVGFFVDSMLSKNDRESVGVGFYISSMICQILFGFLASMIVAWFSRKREFRADAGSAKLLNNSEPMIHALQRLGGMQPGALPKSLAASGISDSKGIMSLLSTHPPIEERIEALRNQNNG